jgi:hypothetical protein
VLGEVGEVPHVRSSERHVVRNARCRDPRVVVRHQLAASDVVGLGWDAAEEDPAGGVDIGRREQNGGED